MRGPGYSVIGREGYEQIVDTILADLAALPGEVQYDLRGNAIASQAGLVELSAEHMGIRLTNEGEAVELTAAQIADIANSVGDGAAAIALGLLIAGVIVAAVGSATVPITGGLTRGTAAATGSSLAAGTAVAASGVEILAEGVIEGDEAHAVGVR